MESGTDLGVSCSAHDRVSAGGSVSLHHLPSKKKGKTTFLIPAPTLYPLILLLSVTGGEQGVFGQTNRGLKSQFCLELAVWP